MASPHISPAFVARALQRRCGGAQVRKDAEGIVETMSKRLEGVRPATASDSAAAVEGWRHMRVSPHISPAFVARVLQRRCGGAQVRKDAEGIVETMSKRLEGVRPATVSDSAAAVEGW